MLLADLGRRGIVNLLVEGGGLTLGSLFDNGLVDKVHSLRRAGNHRWHRRRLPGGGYAGAELMAHAMRLERTSIHQIGPDWLITGYPP